MCLASFRRATDDGRLSEVGLDVVVEGGRQLRGRGRDEVPALLVARVLRDRDVVRLLPLAVRRLRPRRTAIFI